MTATITAPAARAIVAPEVFTIDDIDVKLVNKNSGEFTSRSVQVIVVPTTPDTDLFGEGAWAAWDIFVIEGGETRLGGQQTRFIGNVQQVRLDQWIHEFVGQFVDHIDEDLYVSDTLRYRKAAISSVVRHYYSMIALRERQAAYQWRVEALAEAPSDRCQINHCGDNRNNAHVIIRERVYSACEDCREDYGLPVATEA